MLLTEYNRRLLSGERVDLGPGRSFGVTVPLALQVEITTLPTGGVRRVVACPYCQERHHESMVDLGEVVEADCGDRRYLIVTEAVVKGAGLQLGGASNG